MKVSLGYITIENTINSIGDILRQDAICYAKCPYCEQEITRSFNMPKPSQEEFFEVVSYVRVNCENCEEYFIIDVGSESGTDKETEE